MGMHIGAWLSVRIFVNKGYTRIGKFGHKEYQFVVMQQIKWEKNVKYCELVVIC